MARGVQSVEPLVADRVNGWLRDYGLSYYLEQNAPNDEIKQALLQYESKGGGKGGNRPDASLLLTDSTERHWPVLIEYKGYQGKLVKLDSSSNVDNVTSKDEPNYKNIKEFAVNGAVHYANAILHHTSFEDVIAIGVTGHRDSFGELQLEIGVYYVSKRNFGAGQRIGTFTDLSFLKKENFEDFVERINNLNLSPDALEEIKKKRESQIDANLRKLNNDIYQNEKGISENARVYLVAASIIATLGVPGKVRPLELKELESRTERGETDGAKILRKIESFLAEKNIPIEKKELIVGTLAPTLTTQNLNKPIEGETQLKRIFRKVVEDLGIYYKIGLTTDFTGKLFNEMYSWLGFTQDKLNDVVLTPSYVATLLAKLTRVDKDSYVWDFATGSAGLLVAAMNEMIIDAQEKIDSPDELHRKIAQIKAEQLLGLEILDNIYMLAVLNMIMMGDGSSNLLNEDSLRYSGKYGFGATDRQFPATAFVLNPPYSQPGNGMIFVQRALSLMQTGYAAVIIQNSAGSGKAREFNQKILERNSLIASIKMPVDLFLGKSSVQTNIYVFRVGQPHHKDDVVRFIDFSDDGYSRANRRKAKSGVNLRDTGDAKQKYQEVADLVRFGAHKRNLIPEDCYFEGHIDPTDGADWNQSAPIDTRPTVADLKKTIGDYLAWEVGKVIQNSSRTDSSLGK